ncbi:MAG: preprotein translocase subunit YajC [Clostridia bacterium]|nr:preprotein translocase subunit YajC [Clostridia bacterium]MBP5781122.1 preprotein translocase subunit YajC [Clostridia bacterium]
MNNISKKLLKLSLGLGTFAMASLPGLSVFADGEADGASTNTQPQGSGWPMWIILIIYVAVFVLIGYFLIFRPQKKRKKEEEAMRASLTLGSEVTTIGGITGKVVSIKDDNVTIETSLDRTLFEVKNWAIREIKKLETDDDKK